MTQARGTTIGGLVLAAGEARRFGSPKQLADHRGRPLLEHALAAMAAATALGPRVVVLGAGAASILATVDLHGALPVLCPGWAEGQAASLRAGVAALRADVDAIVVTLGDQPQIDPRAIDLLARARDGTSAAIRAGYAGRPGHPVLIERPLFAPAMALHGDQGARELLADARVVACDGLGSDLDIDLPQQLSEAGSTPAR
jgi:CTP:molybdopterin cytidylyltransferase MocA